MPFFLDTNVLIYVYSKSDIRSEVAAQLLGPDVVICTQCINEALAALGKKYNFKQDDLIAVLLDLYKYTPRLLRKVTFSLAIDIQATTKYHFYDCMILAAALEGGCTTIYSEDMKDRHQIYSGLTIINPFK